MLCISKKIILPHAVKHASSKMQYLQSLNDFVLCTLLTGRLYSATVNQNYIAPKFIQKVTFLLQCKFMVF